jgi:hypothetical protein
MPGNSLSESLTRGDIQAACRPQFWTLPARELTPCERCELINLVTDYLDVIDEEWLDYRELECPDSEM